MNRDQSTDYIVAFAVGAIIGVGAALLLAPEPPTRREKWVKELKPYRKQLRKKTAGARKQMGRQASAAARYGEDLVAASREVMTDLRTEVADLVADARQEIAAAVEHQLAAAQDAVRKRAKRARR